MKCPLALPAGKVSTNGSWQVVGNAGALAVHAIPFVNDLVLFMSRPSNLNDSNDDPYLTVPHWPDAISSDNRSDVQEAWSSVAKIKLNLYRPGFEHAVPAHLNILCVASSTSGPAGGQRKQHRGCCDVQYDKQHFQALPHR